jgi:hypothetical protein
LSNLAEAPTFRISDRKLMLGRIHGQLLLSPDCKYPVRGAWMNLTHDEYGNWEARQHFLRLSLALPIDKPLESLGTENETGSPEGDLAHAPDQVGEA